MGGQDGTGSDLEATRELAATAEALATSLGDSPRLARIRVTQAQGLWAFPVDTGTLGAALERAREAYSLADASDIRTRSYARFVAGVALRDIGDLRGAIEEFDRGAAEFEGVELTAAVQGLARPILASLCAWRAEALAAVGDFDRAVASGEDGQRVADEIGHPIRAMARAYLALALVMRGDVERALPLLEAGLAIAEEVGAAYSTVINAARLAFAHALLGERARAARHIDRIRDLTASVGMVKQKLTGYGSQVVAALLALDRLDEARRDVEESLALVTAHGARGHEPALLRLRADILGRRAAEDPTPALRIGEEALQLGLRPLVADCHATLARLHLRAARRMVRSGTSRPRWRCIARWTCGSGWSRRRQRARRSRDEHRVDERLRR